jgi:hypothetical protein
MAKAALGWSSPCPTAEPLQNREDLFQISQKVGMYCSSPSLCSIIHGWGNMLISKKKTLELVFQREINTWPRVEERSYSTRPIK